MSHTNKLLEKLITSLFYPIVPSPLFIQSQIKHLKPVPCQSPEIDTVLFNTSQKAFSLYKKLPSNETFKKFTYVLLCITSKAPSIEQELKAHLKQGALGMEISYFNPANLSNLRDKVNYAIYNIIHTIYSHGLIYKQLKLESEQPVSITHKHFLDKSKSVLKAYESAVIDCELEFLNFYSKMYILFKNLKKLSFINEIFKSRTILNNFKSNNSNDVIDPLLAFQSNANIQSDEMAKLLKEYESVIFKVYNDCTISYCSFGHFEDRFNEFFIKNHILDYGLIPPFISKKTAETILYIGKYTAFLKSMNLSDNSSNEFVKRIDLSKRSSTSYLTSILVSVNANLKANFFEKLKVNSLLKYIHSTFLFGRIDFIETLFTSFKESRKSSKKNISNILENCLNLAFPNSAFNSLMDIYISQEEREGFSLYIKLAYPVSLLIEEDFVVKLVYIFKFLWKLKKIDHLSRRIGSLKYILLSQKLMFYAFQETIGAFEAPELSSEVFLFDEFKKEISRWIDRIMAGLFINTKSKKIEHLLFNLEKSFLAVGKGEKLDESAILKALAEFYEFSKDSLTGTSLFDLSTFTPTS